jgi:hypothetical protein
MSWQLGSKPGIVDAVDRYRRPMEVGPVGMSMVEQPILLGDEAATPRTGCPPCNGNCKQAHACPVYERDDSIRGALDALWAAIARWWHK